MSDLVCMASPPLLDATFSAAPPPIVARVAGRHPPASQNEPHCVFRPKDALWATNRPWRRLVHSSCPMATDAPFAESHRGREPFSPQEFDFRRNTAEDEVPRGADPRPLVRTATPQLRHVASQTREPRQLSPPGPAISKPSSRWVRLGMAPQT